MGHGIGGSPASRLSATGCQISEWRVTCTLIRVHGEWREFYGYYKSNQPVTKCESLQQLMLCGPMFLLSVADITL